MHFEKIDAASDSANIKNFYNTIKSFTGNKDA